jgi:hypothetical protein
MPLLQEMLTLESKHQELHQEQYWDTVKYSNPGQLLSRSLWQTPGQRLQSLKAAEGSSIRLKK